MQSTRLALISMTLAAATIGLVSVAPATEHDAATGVVKERMDLMKSNGKAMKELSAMVKGERAYAAAEVKTPATSIQSNSGQIPKLFPEGSLQPASEALPAIWRNWPKFEGLARQLGKTSGAVANAADGGLGAMAPAFMDLAKTCNACHTDFRKKKE